jgi:hypothetical protein
MGYVMYARGQGGVDTRGYVGLGQPVAAAVGLVTGLISGKADPSDKSYGETLAAEHSAAAGNVDAVKTLLHKYQASTYPRVRDAAAKVLLALAGGDSYTGTIHKPATPAVQAAAQAAAVQAGLISAGQTTAGGAVSYPVTGAAVAGWGGESMTLLAIALGAALVYYTATGRTRRTRR